MSKSKDKKKSKAVQEEDDDDVMNSLQEQQFGASDEDDDSVDFGMGTFDPQFTQRVLDKLTPEVRNRIYALRGIQDEYVTDAYEQYINEMGLLEKKYEALYAPLYARRAAIINGESVPTEKEVQDGIPEDGAEEARAKIEAQEVTSASASKPSQKGIPGFWLHALQHDHELGKLITERDEPALRALTDIRYVLHDDPKNGFTLLFFFDVGRNEYFENTCLSKRIDFLHENGSMQVTRTVGTEIQWKPHQNLTVLEHTKKQRSKKTKDVRVVTVTSPCPSFFRFFLSNTAGESPIEDDEDGDVDEEDHFKYTAEEDHELALTIKDRIIPRAVEFFTGEADSDCDDDDDDDEYDDEEEEDEEDEEDYRPVQTKGNNRGKGNKASSKEQADCKQQ